MSKKAFFDALGRALLKAGAWCFEHPDQAKAIVETIAEAKRGR